MTVKDGELHFGSWAQWFKLTSLKLHQLTRQSALTVSFGLTSIAEVLCNYNLPNSLGQCFVIMFFFLRMKITRAGALQES